MGTMWLEISAPRVGSLDGQNRSFVGECCRRLQTCRALQAASAAYDRLKVADARAAAAVRAGKEANARAEAAEKMLKAEVRSAAEAAESATKKRDVRARHDQTRAGLLFCTAIPGPWMLCTDKRG